jgi:hypothetical protein
MRKDKENEKLIMSLLTRIFELEDKLEDSRIIINQLIAKENNNE